MLALQARVSSLNLLKHNTFTLIAHDRMYAQISDITAYAKQQLNAFKTLQRKESTESTTITNCLVLKPLWCLLNLNILVHCPLANHHNEHGKRCTVRLTHLQAIREIADASYHLILDWRKPHVTDWLGNGPGMVLVRVVVHAGDNIFGQHSSFFFVNHYNAKPACRSAELHRRP